MPGPRPVKPRAGEDVPVRVFLRPYRGDRIEREIKVHIPAGVARGEHRVLLGDADTLNRVQSLAGSMSRSIDVPQTVSLINQERSNNRLYVALLEASPTAYYDDKMMPSVPASVLNVMQSGRTSSRPVVTSPESASEQASIPIRLRHQRQLYPQDQRKVNPFDAHFFHAFARLCLLCAVLHDAARNRRGSRLPRGAHPQLGADRLRRFRKGRAQESFAAQRWPPDAGSAIRRALRFILRLFVGAGAGFEGQSVHRRRPWRQALPHFSLW